MARSGQPTDPADPAARPRRSEPTVLAVVGAVALIALVALGAGPHDRITQLPTGRVDDRALVEFTAAVTFLLLLTLGFFGVRIVLLLIKDRSGRPPAEPDADGDGVLEVDPARWLQVAIVAAVAVVVGLCVYLLFQFFDALTVISDGGGDAPAPTEPTRAVGASAPAPVGQSVVGNLITLLVIGGAVLLVVALLAGLGRGRLGRDLEPSLDDDEPTTEAAPLPVADPFVADLDELAARPPAEAVVGAFALADAMLRVVGRPRRWGETSAEWVARIRPALPGPVGRALTHLLTRYHEARFSEHPIPPSHRDDAIDALRVLRDATNPLVGAGASSGASAADAEATNGPAPGGPAVGGPASPEGTS